MLDSKHFTCYLQNAHLMTKDRLAKMVYTILWKDIHAMQPSLRIYHNTCMLKQFMLPLYQTIL